MRFRGVVFGWYHQRNAGDDRLAKCIELWLRDHDLTFLTHTAPPPYEVLANADYVLLGGGSIAKEAHGVFQDMARWVPEIGLPVFAVGIGLGNDPKLRLQLQTIPSSGGMLWVRDQESIGWSGCQDKEVVFGPDLSWLYPLKFENLDRNIPVSLSMRPCRWREWNCVDWRDAFLAWKQAVSPWPLCFGRDDDRPVLNDVLGCKCVAHDFDPTVPSRSHLVVAMRYHAAAFAIQAGTPVVVVDNAAKVRELFRQSELPDSIISLQEPTKLSSICERALHTQSSAQLEATTQRLRAEAWIVADHFRERIEDAATRQRRSNKGIVRRIGRRIWKSKK